MKPVTLVIIIAIAIFGSVLAVNFGKNASIYTDFATAQKANRQVHVVGSWVQRDQTNYNPSTDQFTFFMQDTLSNVARVIYHDPKPMNFESAEKVVVIGQYHDDTFVADQIVMKCPSKYEETDVRAAEGSAL